MHIEDQRRLRANSQAFEEICAADPVLVDVRPAREVIPGMVPDVILTSGAPLSWDSYRSGQRNAIIGGALLEGLAADAKEADEGIRSGRIQVRPCHDFGSVGSITGVTTASMPVVVVENEAHGNRAYCTLYEGSTQHKLTYGIFNEEVRRNQALLRDVIGPTLGAAVQTSGGIRLRPIMRRAVHMGDDLHTRNAAATALFARELFPHLMRVFDARRLETEQTISYLEGNDYFFLRLCMAACKSGADSAHGIEGSSIVTAMVFSCREFAIRVSGLGSTWFRGPLAPLQGKVFEGYSLADAEYMGGESIIAETVGLGAFVQAVAFTLQDYSRCSPEEMVQRNVELYQITTGEHPDFTIPFLRFRGAPTGIDIHKVVESGIAPLLHVGIAGARGGQVGAGVMRAPMECFRAAVESYEKRYGSSRRSGGSSAPAP